jgi:hypothetical protein
MAYLKRNVAQLLLIPVITGLLLVAVKPLQAQFLTSGDEQPDPTGALLRSVVMPGWGHYYIKPSDWTRGKYHLAADVVMLISFIGINARSNQLQGDMVSYTRMNAGTDLSGRDRGYQLAVSNFDNREAYNQYNLRTRNWDELYPNEERYQWNWSSADARREYKSLRDRIDLLDRQLPALFSLMVLNRVVSGISAYLRARDMIKQRPQVGLVPTNSGGMATHIQIPF